MKTKREKNILGRIKKELLKKHEGILIGSTKMNWDDVEVVGIPKALAHALNFAISLAYPLNRTVLSSIKRFPTLLYKHHYREVNSLLDQRALDISRFLENLGFNSIPIPASMYVDYKKKKPHLPHRTVALKSGIGWLGRNNCVVDETYGCGIRLVTILTNAPLPQAKAVEKDCGDCYECIQVCPVGAIKENSQSFDLEKCAAYIGNTPQRRLGVEICGVCIRACRVARWENRI